MAAASIAGGVVGVQAQTVEGLESKVDSYTSRVQQAETRIGTLETKVNALDTTGIADNKAKIEAEATARTDADKKHDKKISALEKKTDKHDWKIDTLEKKTGVNTPLSNGATNLSAGVNENTRKIDAEATARENAVNGLQTQVTTQGAQITQLQKDMAQNTIDHVNDVNNINTKLDQKAAKADVEANKNDIASNAAAIKTETQKRENAVNKLQNQVTVASGRIDNLKNQVTENKGAIEKLQTQWNDSNRAFNAEQVNKIDTNKNDIETIFGQLDQGAYNQKDGYVVKHDDTIGGALKNLDKNADKQHWQIDALEKKTGVNTPLINGAFSLSDGVNANTGKINENTSKINALDKTVDKQHWQIDALEKKTGVNTPLTNGATNLSAGVNQNTKLVEAEATARTDADKKHDKKISALEKKTDKHDWKIDTLEKKTGVNTPLTNGATNLSAGVNENTRKIEAEEADRKDADQKLETKLQTNIDNEAKIRENAVNALNSRIGQVESDATKGIAKASALAALHPLDYDPDNKFDIAAAGGFYKGENAFALGAFYRPNRNVMLSMGTTLTSGDNAYNVGLTFKIGKSGKHTEAGLTTADLYAMIGAMQDKMDQQQKKIEELEAKQAK
ncbi:MAG: YadA-like family protein [Segatella copri]|nr:YadA-like family protein [Segatella copri]